MIKIIKNIGLKMDTVFTFPYKNPKSQTISELYKNCVYLKSQGLNISTEYKNKKELIDRVVPFYCKHGLNDHLPGRIQFEFLNQDYFINTKHSFKKLTKLSDINHVEKYHLLEQRGRLSYIVEYDNVYQTYVVICNFKTMLNEQVNLSYFHPILDKIRNVKKYLEVKHIYMNLCLIEDLIKDIVEYIVLQYKYITSTPSTNYIIL
jgi:hypothetical protein